MRRRDSLVFTGLIMAFAMADLATGASAQVGRNKQYATVTCSVEPGVVKPGSNATLVIEVQVTEGYHINAHLPGDENLIPTELTLTAPARKAGVTLGKPVYPEGKTIPSPAGSGEAKVYEGKIAIHVPVTVAKTAKGKVSLSGSLQVQGCNATSCFPPTTIPVSAPLVVKTEGKK